MFTLTSKHAQHLRNRRIGILGGSIDYTGAPFYSAMAALRLGADLAYVLTAEEASQAIKSYSPELMVSSVYNTSRIHKDDEQRDFVNRVTSFFPRLHGLVIGPGMGRNPHVLRSVQKIVERAREIELPLVLDADGLFMACQNPQMLKSYNNAVITPNVVEYRRIAETLKLEQDTDIAELTKHLDGPTVIRKGRVDEICGFSGKDGLPDDRVVMKCDTRGSPRRPGGLGDFLAGSAIVLLSWSVRRYGGTCNLRELLILYLHTLTQKSNRTHRYKESIRPSCTCMSCSNNCRSRS